MVRTLGFHPSNMGSTPVGDANISLMKMVRGRAMQGGIANKPTSIMPLPIASGKEAMQLASTEYHTIKCLGSISSTRESDNAVGRCR